MGGNGSPRRCGPISGLLLRRALPWAVMSGPFQGTDTMMRSPDFGLKGQPHASPGQCPVYYPQPYNLVPKLRAWERVG
jgi:hypothetical protein